MARMLRNVCMGLLTGASAFSATGALAVTPESPASVVIGGGLIPDFLSPVLTPFIGANGVVVGGPATADSGGLVDDLAGDSLGVTGLGRIANQFAGPPGLNLIGQESANGTVDGLVLGLLGNCGALRGGGACDGTSGLLVLPGLGSIPFIGGGAGGALAGIPVLGPLLAPIAGNFLGLVPVIGGGNPDDVIGSFLGLIPVIGGGDPSAALEGIPVLGPVVAPIAGNFIGLIPVIGGDPNDVIGNFLALIPVVGGGDPSDALAGIPVLGPLVAPIAGNFIGLVPGFGGDPNDVIGSFLGLVPVIGGGNPLDALGIIPVLGPVLASLLDGGLPFAGSSNLLSASSFGEGGFASILGGGLPVVGGLLDGGLGGGLIGSDGLVGGLVGGLL